MVRRAYIGNRDEHEVRCIGQRLYVIDFQSFHNHLQSQTAVLCNGMMKVIIWNVHLERQSNGTRSVFRRIEGNLVQEQEVRPCTVQGGLEPPEWST